MIQTIGVIGSGTMGNGIAQVAACAGFKVVMRDLTTDFLQRGLANIDRNLQRDVDKGRINREAKQEILSRLEAQTELDALRDVDFVIEAINEDFAIKTELFKTLDTLVRPEVILSSNTSSISITKLAGITSRPDRFIGMHFFNPVPVMKLLEVVRGMATSDATFATVKELGAAMGKTPIVVNDSPGFVSNRVLLPMINEAVYALYEGVGTVTAIDEVMKLGMNHPMGPLQLADFIGLDVCLAILNVLYDGFNDSKYRPCPLLKKYVDAGWLGRKTGKGFYEY
ncbi:MAG: 3-hydroxybutyryl-CoA dehydrogenase [Acidobacteria bacterium]|nr:3-hydroxybutyryl-CoA dehydrogenase [Acidobacteriota bacterium]